MADTSVQKTKQSSPGAGGVPKGAKTSDYYRTNHIPARFDNPGSCYMPGNPVFSCQLDFESKPQTTTQPGEWFEGYAQDKPVHPMYSTSNSQYGGKPPTVHTMPTSFHCKSQKFSEHLGKCGMFRNASLNCSVDKSNVPDH